MTRTTWIRAHPRKLPERPDAYLSVNRELYEAYQFDRLKEELREQISAEVDRDYWQEAR